MSDIVKEAEQIVGSAFEDFADDLDTYVRDRRNLPESVKAELDELNALEEAVDEYLYALEEGDPSRIEVTRERLRELRND